MNIVHLVDRFPTNARYQDYYLAKYHALAGHDVTVVTTNVNISGLIDIKLDAGQYQLDGFRVVRLPNIITLKNGPILTKGVNHLLKEINPDLIIAHDIVYKILAYQGAYYAAKHGCKFIVDNHASYLNTNPNSSFFKKVYQRIHSRTLADYMLKHANAIVAIAEDEKCFLVNEYGLDPKSIKIIPLGVDCNLFRPDIRVRTAVRNELGIKNNEALIISTGKFDELKQIHILIKAFSKVIKSHPNIKLLLVGKSQQDGYLEYLCDLARKLSMNGAILFRDFAPAEKLAGYFNAADIAVYPGSPSISIQEAMGSGLPLILVNSTSYWKEYLSNHNGFAYNYGDVDDLALKISLLIDQNTRDSISKASRELAENKYNWQIVAKQFLDLVAN